MSYVRVVGVVTQQGTDISGMVNDVCEDPSNLLAPRALVAQCIAESDLDEYAERWGLWPDVSFGILQQTVLYASVGDQSASEANIAHCQEYYSQVDLALAEGAAQLGGYWALFDDLPEHERYLETASRYNGGPSMAATDNPNLANFERAWKASAAYLVGPRATQQMAGYEPETPAVIQTNDWSCSVASTTWGLRSVGIQAGYPVQMEAAMLEAGLVSPQWGLLDASGGALADWLHNAWGLPAGNASEVPWSWVQQWAGHGPLLLGGRAWNHWSGARGLDEYGNVRLANPASSWMGIGDVLTEVEFRAMGTFAAVWLGISEEDEESLSEQDLINQLGYLTGDVANAIQHELDVMRERQAAGDTAGFTSAADAQQSAINTLKAGG